MVALSPQVTKSGEFVFPLDSPHKKPYEVMVLGRYRPSADNDTRYKNAVLIVLML